MEEHRTTEKEQFTGCRLSKFQSAESWESDAAAFAVDVKLHCCSSYKKNKSAPLDEL